MSDIKKFLDVINENSAVGTSSASIGVVAQPMTTERRINKDETDSTAPQVLEYGNWENSAISTSKKLKKARRKASKIVKSVYGEDTPEEKHHVSESVKLRMTEESDSTDTNLDKQAQVVAAKLTTAKNLKKLRGMAHDSTVYRALDRYFAKYDLTETIYNRVANIVFQKINKQGVKEGSAKAWMKHNNLVDLTKPLAGLEAAFNDFLRTHDPEEKAKHQQDVKQRIKTQPMSGPKGKLPEQDVSEGKFFKSNYTFAKDSPVWQKTIGRGAGTREDPYTAKFGGEFRLLAVLMRSLALQMAGLDPGDPNNFGPTDNKLYYKFNDELYMGDGTNKIMFIGKVSNDSQKQNMTEESADVNLDQQAQTIADKLTTDKNLKKFQEQGMNFQDAFSAAEKIYGVGYSKLLDDMPQAHKAHVDEFQKEMWSNNKWERDPKSGRSAVDESEKSDTQDADYFSKFNKESKLDEADLIVSPELFRGTDSSLKKKFHDHEVAMARNDCYQAAKNAKQIVDMLQNVSEAHGIEGWVASKITLASDYLNTVREYLEGKNLDTVFSESENKK